MGEPATDLWTPLRFNTRARRHPLGRYRRQKPDPRGREAIRAETGELIAEFLERGGSIQVLPPEPTPDDAGWTDPWQFLDKDR